MLSSYQQLVCFVILKSRLENYSCVTYHSSLATSSEMFKIFNIFHLELCKAMISQYKRWKSNPLEEMTNDTLAYIKSIKEKILTDENIETVIDFFSKMYIDQLYRFIQTSCFK